MKNKPPAFQFYAKDWLTSKAVLAMTPSQRGYYINLLAHAWDSDRPGLLKDDTDLLWKLAGADSREQFEKDGQLVLEQFPKIGRGNRCNRRLLGERKAQVSRRSDRSRSGSAGAKSRWDNKIHGEAMLLPMAKNGSSSSPAVASSTKDLKPQNPVADPAPDTPLRFKRKTGKALVQERIAEHFDTKKEFEDRRNVEARDRRVRLQVAPDPTAEASRQKRELEEHLAKNSVPGLLH